MSSIDVECPECGAIIAAPAKFAGRAGRCPGCRARVQIPGEAGDTEAEGLEPRKRDEAVEPRHAELQAPLVKAPRYQGPEKGAGVPFLGALGGALVAGFLWSAIAYVSGYELGYAAWGVGLLVGSGCALLGGRGQFLAFTCAALALVAIGCGKFLTTYVVVNQEVESLLTERASPEAYMEARRDARGFARLPESPTPDQVRAFMVGFHFTTRADPADVPDQEVEGFIRDIAPNLVAFAERNETYPQWRNRARMRMLQDFSLIRSVTQNLSATDLLFGLLGVTTAFGVVMAASRRDLERKARVRKYRPRGVRRSRHPG